MDREIAGQPLWLWVTGAGIVILGYLYFRSHSSASSAPQDTGAPPTSTSSFKESIKDWQSPPTTHKTKKKKTGSGDGGGD